MSAPLRHLAKHSLVGAKKQIRLHPLSVDDAAAVVTTVLNASPAPLFRATAKSKQGKGMSNPDVFSTIIRTALDHKRGAVYAAIVTSIDANEVFHTDRFALAMARLGIMDGIASQLVANGFDQVSDLVKHKAPLFWAELSAKELEYVKKELGGTYTKILHKFIENLDTEEIDTVLEATVRGTPVTSLSPKLQFLKGASMVGFGLGQSNFNSLSRSLGGKQNLVLLDKSSSLEGTFSSFYQHFLTDTNALQKIVPRTTFANTKFTTQQFQKIFRDFQVQRRLKQAFHGAYNEDSHSIVMDNLYRSLKRNNFYPDLKRAGKTYARVTLTDDAVSAIISGIIGLFFAFAGDTKGQRLPLIGKR